MHNKLISVLILSILSALGFAQDTQHLPLLDSGEDVLLSFAIQDSEDVLTIATAEDNSYMTYRFGSQDNVTLEFPEDRSDAWNKFVYSFYSRGVGDENLEIDFNYLEFDVENSKYRVYDSFSEEFSKAFVGVTIIDKATGTEADIQAVAASKIGSLSNLRNNRNIKVQSPFSIGMAAPSTTSTESNQVSVIEDDTVTNEITALVSKLEKDIQTLSDDSQESLNRVELAFDDLRNNTLDTSTNTSYWTRDDANALADVRFQTRKIKDAYSVATQTLKQFKEATSPENKQLLTDELLTSYETIEDLNLNLQELETIALSSFETSQNRFLNRIDTEESNAEINSELDAAVLALEQEMATLVNVSQQSLQRVETSFRQLKRDTLNTSTGISYWTVLDEAALTDVRVQVRDIQRNYNAAQENILGLRTTSTTEAQDNYVSDIEKNYKNINALNGELEQLETIAIDGFEASRNKYITRSQNQAASSVTASNTSESTDESASEPSYRLLLGQCFIEAYTEEDCQNRKRIFSNLGYGLAEPNDGTVVAFMIGPFLNSQISDIQTELLTEHGISSARVP